MVKNETAKLKTAIARRIVEIREQTFGPSGIERLARAMRLPVETWRNYESGVTLPAENLLRFMVATGAAPGWLLTGEGPMFLPVGYESGEPALNPLVVAHVTRGCRSDDPE
jgi:hypothetical protein